VSLEKLKILNDGGYVGADPTTYFEHIKTYINSITAVVRQIDSKRIPSVTRSSRRQSVSETLEAGTKKRPYLD
jgi:hypothetical protein